jgi:hypothetical protein
VDYLGGLSDDQLTLLYDVERDEFGTPKLVVPEGDAPPTMEQAFRRRCYLNAVTDPATVDRLWVVERERLAKVEAAAVERAKERRKTRRKVGKRRHP